MDDDARLQRLLKRENFDVSLASNGEEAIHRASLNQPDAVVLDLSMPVMGGFETIERLREWYSAPIIILSMTEDEREKVRVLDLGADDYVTKPYDPSELAARIRSALRRHRRVFDPARRTGGVVHTAGIEVDLAGFQVRKAGEPVNMTATEYELLSVLANNLGKVMSHKELLQAVWGHDHAGETEYLRTFVKQLRRKLEDEPGRPRIIRTEPGIGYRLREL
ncbi:MAG: response regulator transcription factor [Chloroflexota bacterium]